MIQKRGALDLRDPFDKDVGYAKLDGDTLLGLLHCTNSGATAPGIGEKQMEILRIHAEKILRNVIEWWRSNSDQHIADCLIKAHGGGPYDKKAVEALDWLDEKFVGEQLKEREFGYAPMNGTGIMMLLSMANGVFHCDLGWSRRATQKHRDLARSILMEMVDWWRKTSPVEIGRLNAAHYKRMMEMFSGIPGNKAEAV